MNRLIYRLMYRFGRPGWDTGVTPSEIIAAFAGSDMPPGPVLDLGCGTGTNSIYMAQQGRPVYAIDFAAEAITQARKKAQQAGVQEKIQFLVADVTWLTELNLPPCSFALDMGCFHGLSEEGKHRYVTSLAAQLLPGGRFMLFTLDPRREAGISFGIQPDQVQKLFSPWFEIQRIQRNNQGKKGSTWFWLERNQAGIEPQPAGDITLERHKS